MSRITVLTALLSLAAPNALGACVDLKAEIDAKLQSKGITAYSLEIVPVNPAQPEPASGVAASSDSGKVVGTCEGGSKQILYKRVR